MGDDLRPDVARPQRAASFPLRGGSGAADCRQTQHSGGELSDACILPAASVLGALRSALASRTAILAAAPLLADRAGQSAHPSVPITMTPRTLDAEIRPARNDDEHAIHALHVECFRDLFAGLLGDFLPPADQRAERERSWTGPIGCPRDRHALLIAQHHERTIGFVAIGPTRDADNDAQTTGELRTVMVADNARGRGVGQLLLAAGETAMRNHGLSTATLWVLPENSIAVRCYERRGWCADGGEKPISIAGRDLRALRYRKRLSP